jgi:hypothetical protein
LEGYTYRFQPILRLEQQEATNAEPDDRLDEIASLRRAARDGDVLVDRARAG